MTLNFKNVELENSDPSIVVTHDTLMDTMPILPVHDMVAFPRIKVTFVVYSTSARLVEDVMKADRRVGLLTVKDPDVQNPVPGQLYEVGTVAEVVQAQKNQDGVWVVLLKGLYRFRISYWDTDGIYLKAKIQNAIENIESGMEMDVLQGQLKKAVKDVLAMTPDIHEQAASEIDKIKDPLLLSHVAACNVNLTTKTRQSLLEIDSVTEKMRELLLHLSHEKEILDIRKKIESEIRQKVDRYKREYYLRQKLDALKKKLGETEGTPSENNELRERIEQSKMPEETFKEAMRELERMQGMSLQSAEYPMIKKYLDWLLDLPWRTLSQDNNYVPSARKVLDNDHC